MKFNTNKIIIKELDHRLFRIFLKNLLTDFYVDNFYLYNITIIDDEI